MLIELTIIDSWEGHFNWNIDEIAHSEYAMDTCILHWLCLKQNLILLKNLVATNKQNFSILQLVGEISQL